MTAIYFFWLCDFTNGNPFYFYGYKGTLLCAPTMQQSVEKTTSKRENGVINCKFVEFRIEENNPLLSLQGVIQL